MFCEHCKRTTVHFDHNDYRSCSNCGQHVFKEFVITMREIPPAKQKTCNGGTKLGEKTRALCRANYDEITRRIVAGNSWRSVHQWLLTLTDHFFAVETLRKSVRKMMAEAN